MNDVLCCRDGDCDEKEGGGFWDKSVAEVEEFGIHGKDIGGRGGRMWSWSFEMEMYVIEKG